MNIDFNCKYCQTKLEAPDEYSGTELDCPSCGKKIIVPFGPAQKPDANSGANKNNKTIQRLVLALSVFAVLMCFMAWVWPKNNAIWFLLTIVVGAVVWFFARVIENRMLKNSESLNEKYRECNSKVGKYENYMRSTGYHRYDELQDKIKELQSRHDGMVGDYQRETGNLSARFRDLEVKCAESAARFAKTEESQIRETKKIARIKELYKSVKNCLDNWLLYDPKAANCTMPQVDFEEVDMLAPTADAKIHSMDIKDLRKAFRENERQMESLFTQYEGRYTTKANASIYALIVIALRSELQTILLNLRHETTDKANLNIQKALQRAMMIAADGNQSIMPTLTKFIGQLEYHFYEAVKIEHLWYVRREQARLEQIAMREQMRLEAAEQKALAEQKARVEAEEIKYQSEIARLKESMAALDPEKQGEMQERIREVEAHLAEVAVKKEEVAKLSHGKAGTVYVVSNLGSFGEKVFKIGMTRRLDPQERIDELGSASVPFEFDVHSFIFSQDAVNLENEIHNRLNASRLNKVNLRKEFFTTDIDTLEQLVNDIEPTAEFNRTMAAEEFHASQENINLMDVVVGSDDDENDEQDSV